ncbi:MAG: AMP-dependent synthetase, partial [Calditrichaeota bacterium]
MDEVRSKLCHVRHAVLIESGGPPPDDVLTFQQFLQLGDPFPSRLVGAAIERVRLEDLATVMYTSGTTQQPKGIKFSHLNIVSKRFARAIALPEIGEDDTFLCYLPLFHTFGRYFEMLGAIFWGATYVFMESPKIDTMVANMKLAKPTVFISIPKKWIQLYEKIAENVDIEMASEAALRRAVARVTGGRLRWGLSAAGYLDPEIFRFFQMTGVELMSGFGMTEATGGITMTPPGEYRDNSVGKALPGIEVRLAEDGEMMIRGPYVMVGYLHAKNSGIVDGWFRTGDIFTCDKDGFYEIVDRKKEIYKNIRGETISPQKIENLFSDFESVKRVFLVGDHRAYNTVLLYPNYDYDQVNFTKMTREEMRDFFGSLIVSVNQFLASYERIVNFEIIDRDFSAERGELTQKGTFKRKAVEENFRELIEAMYRKRYTIFRLGRFEVRVPNWFLREHGLTIENLKLAGNALVIPALHKRLRLRLTQQPETVIQIGELCYTADQGFIDLGEIVQHPVFWLGNLELEEFVGSALLRDAGSPPRKSRGVRVKLPPRAACPNLKAVREFRRLRKADKPDLRGLHLAAHLFVTCNTKNLQHTLDFFEKVLAHKDERVGRLGRIVLKRTQFAPNIERRRIAFHLLVRHERSERFKEVLDGFAKTRSLFTRRLIQEISELNLSRQQLQVIFAALRHHLNSDSPPGESERALVFSLLELLTAYGVRHPTAFKSIRAEMVRWTFDRRDEKIRKRAEAAFNKLRTGFRRWLGPNQQIAVSVETGTEYGWPDVLNFEDNL